MSSSPTTSLLQRVAMAAALFTALSWLLLATLVVTWAPARGAAARGLAQVTRSVGHEPLASPATRVPWRDARLAKESGGRCALLAADDPVARGERVLAMGFGMDSADADFAWHLDSDGDPDWLGSPGQGSAFEHESGESRLRFRDDGEWFVVRDPAIVAETRAVARPLSELGHEMGARGRELGRRGARMGRLGGRLGTLSARLAVLETRSTRHGTARADLARRDAELRELRDEVARSRSELGRAQEELTGVSQEHSRRMAEKSTRFHELARETRAKIRDIARRARREGKAERPHAKA